MKTSKRFNNAISALVKGFFNETLAKGDCSACAVGNIVGESIGYTPTLKDPSFCEDRIFSPNSHWADVFVSVEGHGQMIREYNYEGQAKENIDSTGYSWKELAKVEEIFELASKIHYENYRRFTKEEILQDQYNGLMAVVDVLCEIEGIDTKEYKDMFSYKCEDSKLIKV